MCNPCNSCKLPWVGSCCPYPCCGFGCPKSPCCPSVPGYCGGPQRQKPLCYSMCPPRSLDGCGSLFSRTYNGIPVLTSFKNAPCCQSCCCPEGNDCTSCIKIKRCNSNQPSSCSGIGAPQPPNCGY